MLCCICNRVPVEAVVAKTSGCLFERSLIEKYVDEHGHCPVTGEPLSKADLLPVRPSPASASASAAGGLAGASIPTILDRLHAEWDAVMLEQFAMRQRLAQMQQDLAHALQQYEAACRVIATLTKQCDDLRRNGGGEGPGEDVGPVDVLPRRVVDAIDGAEASQRRLRKERRSNPSADAVTSTKVAGLAECYQFRLEGGSALCVACDPQDNAVYTAGTGDHAVVRYCTAKQRVTGTACGHTGAVHTLAATSACVLSASEDSTVRVWREAAESQQQQRLPYCATTLHYESGVAAMSRHVIAGTMALTASANARVALSDVERGEHIAVTAPWGGGARDHFRKDVTAVEAHPYGSVAAIATSAGDVVLWDVKYMSVDTILSLPLSNHRGGAAAPAFPLSLAFSPDCVTLASGLSDGTAYVWDLRNIETPIAFIVAASGRAAPASVAYDTSAGSYLAVASEGVRLYEAARLSNADEEAVAEALLTTLQGGSSSPVRGVCWDLGAARVCTSALDGVVTIYGASA